MWRSMRTVLAVAAVVLCIGGPVVFAFQMQTQTRNFHVVREGVLYRSGQTTLLGLKNLLHEYRIRTVVSLRDADTGGDLDRNRREEEYCVGQEINYVRIPPLHWQAADGEGPAPADEGVRRFRDVMSDPHNYPVLVHCLAGIHRTGAYCAVYRMEFDHWSNERAIEELKAFGYSTLADEGDIRGYLEHYTPTWKRK